MSDTDAAIDVRLWAAADIPALAAFLAAMERELGGTADVAAVERDLRALHPGPEFLLATTGDAIVGLAAFSVLYPSSGSGLSAMLYLKELYVAAAFRRGGVARLLMARLAKIAGERGCPRLGWNTPRDNGAAQALYDQLGAQRAEYLLTYRLHGEALATLAALAD